MRVGSEARRPRCPSWRITTWHSHRAHSQSQLEKTFSFEGASPPLTYKQGPLQRHTQDGLVTICWRATGQHIELLLLLLVVSKDNKLSYNKLKRFERFKLTTTHQLIWLVCAFATLSPHWLVTCCRSVSWLIWVKHNESTRIHSHEFNIGRGWPTDGLQIESLEAARGSSWRSIN
jgi:hypothetical protein